jgi:hypothetical protein
MTSIHILPAATSMKRNNLVSPIVKLKPQNQHMKRIYSAHAVGACHNWGVVSIIAKKFRSVPMRNRSGTKINLTIAVY